MKYFVTFHLDADENQPDVPISPLIFSVTIEQLQFCVQETLDCKLCLELNDGVLETAASHNQCLTS